MRSAYSYPHRVIAHRGGGTLAPENTLAGLREAHVRGFRAVEFDVMLTGDAAPILMHDDTLERTTNGRGQVGATAAADLARLDAGSWRDARFAGESVPGFDAAAQACVELGLWANVEIKPWAPGGAQVAERTGAQVAGAAARLLPASRVLLSSFSPQALSAARAACRLDIACLFDALPADWREQVAAVDAVAVHCNAAHLTDQGARAIKASGLGLMCWTVNDPAQATRLFGMGVDAVCTDRLDLLPPA
ncbi:MAG: glycerophosphodiester phosphodiesterase [Burkholderiales bacterium]